MDIIAHRGASAHAPENTLAAFRLAWDAGADGIELDVHLSGDGRVMVHHDADTLRSAGVALTLAQTHSAILRDLDVGLWRDEAFFGEAMPFLEEVLAAAPTGGKALVEIKCGPEIILALQAALAQSAARLQLALIAMRLNVLVACRAAMPDIPCYWVIPCVGLEGQETWSPHPLDLIEQAKGHDVAGLDPDYRGISAEFSAAVRDAGLGLITWTVNDPAAARRLRDLGVDAITTNYPAAMRQALASDGWDR